MTDTSEVIIFFTITDNVGNIKTDDFLVVLDTDEVIRISGLPVSMGEAIPFVDEACTQQQ